MSGPTPYWWRHHRRGDTLTRALARNMAETNAQFQTRRWPVSDGFKDRFCWGVVIALLAIAAYWALMHAPASFFRHL